MTCSSHRNIIVEELDSLLTLTKNEISELEKQRNELKSQFLNRHTDEKNIVKDVLAMHSEFDTGVEKIKEVINELASIPLEKVQRTAKAEDLASEIVKYQKELVAKHQQMQIVLAQKVNFQALKEESSAKCSRLSEKIDEDKFRVTEIENLEHGNIYNKKVRLLNSELSRLKNFVNGPNPTLSFNFENQSELFDNSIIGISISEANIRLQEQKAENKALEQEIGNINSKFLSKESFLRMKKEVEDKKKRVEELRKVLKGADEEIKLLMSPGSPRLKIKLLDTIVGRRSPFGIGEQLSPRSMKLKNSTLLQDIEASLKRVKAISSPAPKN